MADQRGDVRAGRKGQPDSHQGHAERADWNKNAYVRYGGRKQQATVQFKAAGSDSWIPVKTVTFSATGQISAHVTVKREVARDGWYRLQFAGTANSSLGRQHARLRRRPVGGRSGRLRRLTGVAVSGRGGDRDSVGPPEPAVMDQVDPPARHFAYVVAAGTDPAAVGQSGRAA